MPHAIASWTTVCDARVPGHRVVPLALESLVFEARAANAAWLICKTTG